MICSAARMRTRLPAAAPVMVLGGLRWHAGGAAAALLLWMAAAALLPCRERYPYPRKRSIRFHKLFFCFALIAFISGGAAWLLRRFSAPGGASLVYDLLVFTGAAGFSLPIGKRALSLLLSPVLTWGLGAALCVLFVLMLIFQTPQI